MAHAAHHPRSRHRAQDGEPHLRDEGRRDGRARPAEEVFTAPKHPYTKRLLEAQPKGEPPRVDDKAPVILEADGLKVWFPVKQGILRRTVSHIKAVDGVSFKLRSGQTLGIVGESGSGKTTLGLAIMRLVSSEGPIAYVGKRIDGLKSAEMRPFRREMQIVFQDPYGSLSPAPFGRADHRGRAC